MPEATDPAVFDDSDPVGGADGDGFAPDEGLAVARVTARLAGLDLDVRSLELIMAALTVDLCGQVDTLSH